MSTFVVSTEEEQCIGIPDLQRPEVQDALPIDDQNGKLSMDQSSAYLNAEVSTIDIVPEEKISGICRAASNLKQFHQVELWSQDR